MKHYITRIKEGKLQEMQIQFRWICAYAKKHLVAMIIYTILGLSGTVIALLGNLVSKDVVDIITGHQTGELIFTFCMMICMNLTSTLLGQISSYVSAKINIKVDNNIKADIFDKIMVTDWESLTGYHTGDLLVRWSSDVSNISSGILSFIPNLAINLFRFFMALVMVLRYDASFAFFSIVSIPISIFLSRNLMKRMRRENINSMAIGAKMSGFNQETFSNIQFIKSFNLVRSYGRRLREIQTEYSSMRMKLQKLTVINSLLLTLVTMIISYSAYGWGIYRVWSGAITYGTMTMFLALSATLTSTVNNLTGLIPTTISLFASTGRLMDIVEMPKEDYSQDNDVATFYEKNKLYGMGIRVCDIDYAYRNGTSVFENVSLEANPHEVIALVGPSGEGKTTMLRLLLSLINSQNGRSYIYSAKGEESIDLTASTRQLFSYVPQGNTMFSGTIAENMRNIKEDATDEEIVNALKLACAWDFVEKLPDGINSEIKERGGGFSEGQAQRLSIARALLRHSPILLLDEATSALDVATERRVLKNIMQDEYPRTSIVTTHRPTVLSICNRVYAIRDKKCAILNKQEIDKMIDEF